MRRGFVVILALGLSACTTYRDQLARSQKQFEQNNYEETVGLLRALETDRSRLTFAEQARYAYLRGMSDYRIGYRTDARHWLALARTYEERTPGVLPADWKVRLEEALEEMNSVVYTDGYAALGEKLSPDDAVSRAKSKKK